MLLQALTKTLIIYFKTVTQIKKFNNCLPHVYVIDMDKAELKTETETWAQDQQDDDMKLHHLVQI